MAQKTINIGTTPNDGTGDQLRTAFDKVNDNFTELYGDETSAEVNSVTAGDGLAGTSTTGAVTLSVNVDDSTLEINTDALRIKDGGVVSSKLENNVTIQGNLTVDTNTLYVDSSNNAVGIGASNPNEGNLQIGDADTSTNIAIAGNRTKIGYDGGDTILFSAENIGMKFYTGHNTFAHPPNERLRITSGGDISFFDTSENQALYWDASTARLGIGTTSPQTMLDLASNNNLGTALNTLRFTDTDSTAVTNAEIGKIEFFATDTNAVVASIVGHNADPSPDGYLAFNTAEGTVLSERLRIKNNGNVGIGTDSPSATLEVNKGSEGEYLRVGGDNANNARSLRFTSSTSSTSSVGALHTIKANSVGGEIAFANGDGNIMYLQDGGNVGIGTDSPSAKLEVIGGTNNNANSGLVIKNSTGATRFAAYTEENVGVHLQANEGGSARAFMFDIGGSEAMRIDSSGKVGIGTTSPSAALDVISSNSASQIKVTSPTPGIKLIDYNLTTRYAEITAENGSVKIDVDPGQAESLSIFSIDIDNAERMRIDSSGNVGIGLTNATAKLHVVDTSNSGTNDQIVSGLNSGSPRFKAHIVSYNGVMSLYDSGTNEDVRITSKGGEDSWINNGGNVGIGTTSPQAPLHVNGGSSTGFATVKHLELGFTSGRGFTVSTSQVVAVDDLVTFDAPTATYGQMAFNTAGSEAMRITSTGNVGIGTTSPAAPLTVKGEAFVQEAGVNGEAALRIQYGTDGNTALRDRARLMSVGYSGTLELINSSNSLTTKINSTGSSYFNGGNVGIGTTSPSRNLTISSSGTSTLQLTNTTLGETTTDGFQIKSYTSGAVQLWNYENNYIAIATNNSERMRIDSSGNVGIGEADPDGYWSQARQLVLSGTNNGLTIKSSTAGNGRIVFTNTKSTTAGLSDGGMISYSHQNNAMIFNANGSEAMRITSSGRVLIGTTTEIGSVDEMLQVKNNNGGARGIAVGNSEGDSNTGAITFYNSNGIVGDILTNGSATSYNTSSDYRLKENVVPMEGALDRVDALKPSRFNFIADADKTVDGFLAHELAEVIPEATTGEKDAVDEDGNAIYQGIDQSKIVPLLVGAIQELKAEIEILKSQINP